MAVGVAAAAMLAGTALTIYGQRKASKARQSAMNARANALREKASFLKERFKFNKEALYQVGEVLKSAQIGAFAKGGVDISAGSPLMMMEAANSEIEQQLAIEQKELDAQVASLESGADIETSMMGQEKSASRLRTLSTALSGGSQAYSQAKKG